MHLYLLLRWPVANNKSPRGAARREIPDYFFDIPPKPKKRAAGKVEALLIA